MAAKAPSVAGETLKDAKRRAMETYEEHYGRGHVIHYHIIHTYT